MGVAKAVIVSAITQRFLITALGPWQRNEVESS